MRAEGVSKAEEKIPFYRALKAIAEAGQVDVEDIRDSVEQAVLQANEPLASAVRHFPNEVATAVAQAMEPLAKRIDHSAKKLENALGLIQEIHSEVISDEEGEEIEEISEEVDEKCIHDAFEFMRTLNQIEDLIADQHFEEEGKDNSQLLQGYRDRENSLYTDCLNILKTRQGAGEIDEATAAEWKEEFDVLFNAIASDCHDRAQRLVEVQAFREKVLDFFFFSGQCKPNQQPNAPA